MIDYEHCLNSFLAFRYVTKENVGWKAGYIPTLPSVGKQDLFTVSTPNEIRARISEILTTSYSSGSTGILLSGGIDSAILAALMPTDIKAYTVKFEAPNAIDESKIANKFAKILGIDHTVINVSWNDYRNDMRTLMRAKKSPLHAAEVGLYKASQAAHIDGIDTLAVGNGADSTFGGMDKLLSKNWTFNEFVERYTFINPKMVLKEPSSIIEIYEPYRTGQGVDVEGFLKTVHGLGIVQMFENAIHCGGCKIIAPYENLTLGIPLDIQRIREGESKYLLRLVFSDLFPNFDIPEKIPFARPMQDWMNVYVDTNRPEFLDDLDLERFSGEQKWLIYCLEDFLNMIEEEN